MKKCWLWSCCISVFLIIEFSQDCEGYPGHHHPQYHDHQNHQHLEKRHLGPQNTSAAVLNFKNDGKVHLEPPGNQDSPAALVQRASNEKLESSLRQPSINSSQFPIKQVVKKSVTVKKRQSDEAFYSGMRQNVNKEMNYLKEVLNDLMPSPPSCAYTQNDNQKVPPSSSNRHSYFILGTSGEPNKQKYVERPSYKKFISRLADSAYPSPMNAPSSSGWKHQILNLSTKDMVNSPMSISQQLQDYLDEKQVLVEKLNNRQDSRNIGSSLGSPVVRFLKLPSSSNRPSLPFVLGPLGDSSRPIYLKKPTYRKFLSSLPDSKYPSATKTSTPSYIKPIQVVPLLIKESDDDGHTKRRKNLVNSPVPTSRKLKNYFDENQTLIKELNGVQDSSKSKSKETQEAREKSQADLLRNLVDLSIKWEEKKIYADLLRKLFLNSTSLPTDVTNQILHKPNNLVDENVKTVEVASPISGTKINVTLMTESSKSATEEKKRGDVSVSETKETNQKVETKVSPKSANEVLPKVVLTLFPDAGSGPYQKVETRVSPESATEVSSKSVTEVSPKFDLMELLKTGEGSYPRVETRESSKTTTEKPSDSESKTIRIRISVPEDTCDYSCEDCDSGYDDLYDYSNLGILGDY